MSSWRWLRRKRDGLGQRADAADGPCGKAHDIRIAVEAWTVGSVHLRGEARLRILDARNRGFEQIIAGTFGANRFEERSRQTARLLVSLLDAQVAGARTARKARLLAGRRRCGEALDQR